MRVLIVDDSKMMRLLLKKTFRQAGYDHVDFTEAENGQVALDMVREDRPDLLLTDINMPIMDGLTLLENLQSEGIKLKAGVISSQSTAEIVQRSTSVGASFLLSKPFTSDSLKFALGKINCEPN